MGTHTSSFHSAPTPLQRGRDRQRRTARGGLQPRQSATHRV